MNEVRVIIVGYVDALVVVERVPNCCGLDGGGCVLVAVSVVVEDMVLFFFFPRRAGIGGSFFSNNIWLGTFSRSRFLV